MMITVAYMRLITLMIVMMKVKVLRTMIVILVAVVTDNKKNSIRNNGGHVDEDSVDVSR